MQLSTRGNNMYILIDFAFVPMTTKKWDKVLDKWISTSKKYSSLESSVKSKNRLKILNDLKNTPYERTKLEFLKKKYQDPKTNKQRKLTTGIAAIPQKDSKKVVVDLLVNNPKSIKDPKFKGAIDSLDKKVGKRKVDIIAVNDPVYDLYTKKFDNRLI